MQNLDSLTILKKFSPRIMFRSMKIVKIKHIPKQLYCNTKFLVEFKYSFIEKKT